MIPIDQILPRRKAAALPELVPNFIFPERHQRNLFDFFPLQRGKRMAQQQFPDPPALPRGGDLNREIEVKNQRLRQLKARIGKLRDWLKEEAASTEPSTLADYIQDILRRKAQAGKSDVSQSLYNLKDAANMLNFLTANNIMDMAGLDGKFSSMIEEQMDIQDKLNPLNGD